MRAPGRAVAASTGSVSVTRGFVHLYWGHNGGGPAPDVTGADMLSDMPGSPFFTKETAVTHRIPQAGSVCPCGPGQTGPALVPPPPQAFSPFPPQSRTGVSLSSAPGCKGIPCGRDIPSPRNSHPGPPTPTGRATSRVNGTPPPRPHYLGQLPSEPHLTECKTNPRETPCLEAPSRSSPVPTPAWPLHTHTPGCLVLTRKVKPTSPPPPP